MRCGGSDEELLSKALEPGVIDIGVIMATIHAYASTGRKVKFEFGNAGK
jgi:hypothetical protein